jgi:hypothetical protein
MDNVFDWPKKKGAHALLIPPITKNMQKIGKQV